MLGKQINQYKILDKLGEGGMGVVYKAEDTKLKRMVALKFLAANLTQDDEARERFMNEARAASALDHVNICTLHDINDTADGQMYISMAHYDGGTLKDRLTSGALLMNDAVDVAIQIAKGLARAHEAGIIHRDIKPANIIITERGEVKIVDFGLAKLIGLSHLTQTGSTLGTVSYMSPEQAQSLAVDHRTDVWSLGVVLYEMLTGVLPFEGEYDHAVVYALINEKHKAVTEINPELPAALSRIIERGLAKRPCDRYESMEEMLADLLIFSKNPGSMTRSRPITTRQRMRRPRFTVLALAIVLLLATAIFLPYQHLLRIEKARELLPKIDELAQAGNYFEAYQLAVQAEKVLDNDSTIVRLLPMISDKITITTEPAGARVMLRRFAPDSSGQSPEGKFIGATPIDSLRIGRAHYYVLVEKAGYVPVERIASSALVRNDAFRGPPDIKMDLKFLPTEETPENMVFVPGGDYQLVSHERPTTANVKLDDFFIDRFEVTNEQYKEFISAGGYGKKNYWNYPIIKDGREISWQEAVQHFTDRTTLAGPRNWLNQDYPDGEGNHPVTGITWFEAAAYAEFKGKQLPTIFQWEKAARNREMTFFVGFVYPWGMVNPSEPTDHRLNAKSKGTVPVNSYEFGLSPFGCYNMAGNAREWLVNEMLDGFATGGGSWEEPVYGFAHVAAFPGLFASSSVGFRCVKVVADSLRDQGAMHLNPDAEIPTYTPVDDVTYQGFLSHYKYDKKPLEAKVVEVRENTDWRMEKVTFNSINDDRIIAYLYLPKRAVKPYQCISFLPGGDFFISRGGDEYAEWALSAQIKTGRAVFVVVTKGAVERLFSRNYEWPKPNTVRFRDIEILWTTEQRIGLDYLTSRDDIDMDKIAFVKFSGMSVAPAVDDRYKSVIFIGGGIHSDWEKPVFPEANLINFMPRIKIPKLMLNGRYDEATTLRLAALPAYNLLKEPKRLEVVDGGHMPSLEIRTPIIKNWLDETLGPVKFELED